MWAGCVVGCCSVGLNPRWTPRTFPLSSVLTRPQAAARIFSLGQPLPTSFFRKEDAALIESLEIRPQRRNTMYHYCCSQKRDSDLHLFYEDYEDNKRHYLYRDIPVNTSPTRVSKSQFFFSEVGISHQNKISAAVVFGRKNFSPFVCVRRTCEEPVMSSACC